MSIIFVCRTHGRALSEFMFRPGSNVGITVANGIAIEGAGRVYTELHAAAISLNYDALWKTLSSKRVPAGKPLQKDILELLDLEKQGRHADLVAHRKKLRDLHAALYSLYMASR